MAARQTRGEKFRRTTLYLTPRAAGRLEEEAVARSSRAGVEVSPEAMARGLVYSGLGLSPDGITTGVAEVDWLVMLRHVARAFGGEVVATAGRAAFLMEPGTTERTCKAFADEINKHAPPPAGVLFEVKAAT